MGSPALLDDQPEPDRILLVRLSHLGDACHALALFHGLRERFPRAEIRWALQPEFQGLVVGMEGLAGCVDFDRKGGLRAWHRLRNELRAWKPDWAVDGQGNWKSAMVMRASGAKVRLGMAKCDWREASAAWVTTHRAQPATGTHAMDRMKALLNAFHPAGVMRMDPGLSGEEREQGRDRLANLFPQRELGRTRVVHLSTPGDPRSWPAASYATLLRLLSVTGEQVLCLSGPAEEELGRKLVSELADLPGVVHWVGQRGLRELAGFLHACGEERIRLLACDSGPCHIAAAVGQSVDLLVGPTDAARTGPWPTAIAAGHTSDPTAHRSLQDPDRRDAGALSPDAVSAWLTGRTARD